jgi:pimeloyl-ACP methyl ester carboxylesterase
LAEWQAEARARLGQALGLHLHAKETAEAILLGSREQEGYTEEHWQLPIDEGVFVNAYILRPHGTGPFVPLLVLHGHNPSVQSILGHYPSEEITALNLAKDGNYGQALVQAGYLVCAVEQRGFGERTSDGHGQEDQPYTDRHLFLHYLMQGRCLQGERVWDAMNVLDWFLAFDGIEADKLVCTGNSGGGVTTAYLAAMDERVRIAIPASCFASYRESILSEYMSHCLCNYIPGLGADFELGDIAALIAPRPLRLINGEEDRIFPIATARSQFETVAAAYQAAGQPEKADLAVHTGGHRYHLALSTEWIERWAR